jgi:hypothetical protein
MDVPQNSTAPDFIDTTNPHGAEPLVSAEEIAAIARQAVEDVSRSTAASVGAALGTPPVAEESAPPVPDVVHVPAPPAPAPAASETFTHVPLSPSPAPAPAPAAATTHESTTPSPAVEAPYAHDVIVSDEQPESDPLAPFRGAADYAAQNPIGLALVSFALGIFVGIMLPGRKSKPQDAESTEAAA